MSQCYYCQMPARNIHNDVPVCHDHMPIHKIEWKGDVTAPVVPYTHTVDDSIEVSESLALDHWGMVLGLTRHQGEPDVDFRARMEDVLTSTPYLHLASYPVRR